MKSIEKLRRKKKKLVIIGSGHSVKEFKFPSRDEYDFMGINFCPVDNLNYLVCDKRVPERLPYIDTILIGFKMDDVDFYFDDCIDFGNHTGYRALQIAVFTMKYKEIYLIGFDYYCEQDPISGRELVHWFGDEIHYSWIGWDNFYRKREKYFKIHIEDFNKKNWEKYKIFNCNYKSKLKLFPFKGV